jgi:hypothetical protein
MGFSGPGSGGVNLKLERAKGRLRKDKVLFFPNLFLMRKQFQKNLEIVLKARKILRKIQKFPEID